MSNNISANNNFFNTQSPEFKRKYETQENFTALDKEKLKQDTVELAQKAGEKTQQEVNDNFIVRGLKSVGIKDPKKFFKSVGLTILTVIGFAFVGNKLAMPTAKAGLKVDKFLLEGDNFLAKGYRAVAKFFARGKDKIAEKVGNSKSKFVQDLVDTFKNRKAKPINTLAKSYGSGGKGIFGLTAPDILRTSLKETSGLNKLSDEITKNLGVKSKSAESIISTFFEKGADDTLELLKNSDIDEKAAQGLIEKLSETKGKIDSSLSKLFQEEAKESIFKQIFVDKSYDHIALSQEMVAAIKNGKTEEEFIDYIAKNFGKDSKEFAEFVNVKMDKGGIMGSWWPVNIIDSIGKKIKGDSWKGFARGNLGDSLLKFSAMDGTAAKTFPGRFVQKSVIFPAEYISNFVNDKSGLGVFLCANLMTLYNTAQDAPEGQKVSTVANDFASTIGSVAITTPLAAAATYGLATLKNLDGKGLAAIPKAIGKFVGLGLDSIKNGEVIKNTSKMKGFVGGFIRAILILFVISPKITKPIQNAIQKVFGKPYDPAAEEAAKAAEEQKNQIIPELGITQAQLAEKIEKNPEAMERIKNDDELAAKLVENPKLIVDLLDGKDINATATATATQAPTLSPANANLLNNNSNLSSEAELFSNKNKEEKPEAKNVDTATYIPSSQFKAKASTLTDEQQKEYNSQMSRADKILKKAEGYLR